MFDLERDSTIDANIMVLAALSVIAALTFGEFYPFVPAKRGCYLW